MEGWHRGESFGKDVGFSIVNKQNNKTLEEVVGKLGFKVARKGTKVEAVGYPVPRFGGQKMVHSPNATIQWENSQYNPPTIGIYSSMEGGCSGGPWVCENLTACGVNSHGVPGQGRLWSPGFNEDIAKLRDYAIQQ